MSELSPTQGTRPMLPAAAVLLWAVALSSAYAEVRNPDGVAVIISNKDYQHEKVGDVSYADRDATAFKAYVIDVLGFDPENIIERRDATQADLTSVFGSERDHQGFLWRYLDPAGNSDVVVFYSGHGVPGLKDRRGYLLPVDTHPDTAELNGYPIDLLYENLGKLHEARTISVFLEACFSGESARGMLVSSASPVYVTAELPEVAGEKLTVLTAASGTELATWDEEARHGMFTNHLLDALYGQADADGDARVTAGEVVEYLNRHMTRAARRLFGRHQNASLNGLPSVVLSSAEEGAFPQRREALGTTERIRSAEDRLEELAEIQADLWVPVSFHEMVDAVQRVEEMLASGDLMGAYRLALATADDMLALRDSLLNRLELLYGKRRKTERCLTAAQQLDTSDRSASRLEELRSLYQQLNALYLAGLEAMQSYRLTDAEEAFGAAVEVCRRLMAVADDAYTDQMERAAALLTAVMEEIEEASRLHVVTDLGDVIRPQPWSGQPVLDALRAGPARRKAILDGIDPEDPNLLHKAQGLWIEGVAAFDDQKYGQSIRLFEDARRYLDLYKFYAVLGSHFVQLIPERRESLWRIAEYPRWYDDPFLWPRIWRRNRDLIQNPDLIYPGWQLIIPAL